MHQWREGVSLDLRLLEPEFLQLRERRQQRDALILQVNVGQKVNPDVQLDQILEAGEVAQLFVSVQLVAGGVVPHVAGQKEFAQIGHSADAFEIAWIYMRA